MFRDRDIYLIVVSVFSGVVTLGLFFLQIKGCICLNEKDMLLYLSAVVFFFAPSLSKIKFFGIELERQIEEVKENLYRGKVVKSSGDYYFIDKDTKTHKLPDIQTAKFLQSSEGIFEISYAEFKGYKEAEAFISIDQAEFARAGNDIFVFLDPNQKLRFYVTVSDLYDLKKFIKNEGGIDVNSIKENLDLIQATTSGK